jgi:hypothetical protein
MSEWVTSQHTPELVKASQVQIFLRFQVFVTRYINVEAEVKFFNFQQDGWQFNNRSKSMSRGGIRHHRTDLKAIPKLEFTPPPSNFYILQLLTLKPTENEKSGIVSA